MYGRAFVTMDLFIETLAGTSMELRVSPYDTVYNIKERIYKLEGIPISQQHLVYQTTELDDDVCLRDYNIKSGATLRLVLTMRGGPVNTRRVPVEDPTLREMAEYFTETNSEEYASRPPVTVVVYHNGSHLNFFRLVDRDASSSLSYSFSGTDYNPDDDDSPTPKERRDENEKTKDKMKLLRSQMETLNMTKEKRLSKKLSQVPRPPSGFKRATRLRHSATKRATLNKNTCLPPVGQSLPVAPDSVTDTACGADTLPGSDVLPTQCDTITRLGEPTHSRPSTTKSRDELPSVHDRLAGCDTDTLRTIRSNIPQVGPSSRGQVAVVHPIQHPLSPHPPPQAPSASDDKPTSSSGSKPSSGTSGSKLSAAFPPSPLRRSGVVKLQTMNPVEVRAMSGMINSLVNGAHPSRSGYLVTSTTTDLSSHIPRKPTPECRLLSARDILQTLSRDGGTRSPAFRLPSVRVTKKKHSKRCTICGKKTRLATGFQCRCGNNFCSVHRYAEAHDCTYDYKAEGRKILEQSNPVVTAPKLPKI